MESPKLVCVCFFIFFALHSILPDGSPGIDCLVYNLEELGDVLTSLNRRKKGWAHASALGPMSPSSW